MEQVELGRGKERAGGKREDVRDAFCIFGQLTVEL
jgi:hypothetical protein